MPSGFRIGRFSFGRPALLAPMSGITDLPFRRIAARFGAPYVVSEMVASESLVIGNEEMALRTAGEGMSPHVVQLAGREPRWMAEAARLAEGAGADIIDINMGCPSKRVTTGYSGAALMRDLELANAMIEATVAATALPVTLKMRLGWDRGSINAPELARRAQAAGVAMITVHGRTRDQFYDGTADWGAIRPVVEAVSLPVIANGDCLSAGDAVVMMAASGAAGVMVGRGAQGKPWLPAVITAQLEGRPRIEPPQGEAFADVVAAHYDGILAHYGVKLGIRCARKHLGWYLDTLTEAGHDVETFRRSVLTCDNPATVVALMREAAGADMMRAA